MTGMTKALEALWAELESVLDEEVALLDLRRRQLESLCGCLVDRDQQALAGLLEQIDATQRDQQSVDIKLQACRNAVARAMGRDPQTARLSELIAQLPQDRAIGLDYKREQIVLQAQQLKRRNFESAVLLHESARINRMLLDCLAPVQENVETYGQKGSRPPRRASGLVDAER